MLIKAMRVRMPHCELKWGIPNKFLELPQGNPTIRFTLIEPHRPVQIEGYSILAIPVKHPVPAVGYQVTSPDGKAVFYTGDTGSGLIDCWQYISPQLLVVEVMLPNRCEKLAALSGHHTPSLLNQELRSFRELKGYLPPIVAIHMEPPPLENEIKAEISVVAEVLNASITLAYKGMRLHL